MKQKRTLLKRPIIISLIIGMVSFFFNNAVGEADLAEVKEKGVLRHLGVPYANFITGSGDGMSVELMRLFAEHLGVNYEYVQTSWKDVIGDLTGKRVKAVGEDIEIIEDVPIKGDVIANGLTQIPWREKIVNYSIPTFPTQVWLIARVDSGLVPIEPTGDIEKDIQAVKAQLNGESVLCVANTCLDSKLYKLEEENATIINFTGNLNELAPAVIGGDADASILDVPDALVALEKWAGQIKVIGPISKQQIMGEGFRKDSPKLLEAYNNFLEQSKKDGTFISLVKKYYPAVFDYYAEFFEVQTTVVE